MTPLLHLSRTLFLFLDVVLARTITVFSIMFRTHVRAFHVPHVLHYAASFLIISHTCTPVIVINYHRRHRLPQLCVVCCFPPSPRPSIRTSTLIIGTSFYLFSFFSFLTVLLITPLCLPSSAYAMTTRYRPAAPPRTYSTHLKTSFQTPTLSFLSSPGISFGICRVEMLLYAW